MIDTVTKLNRRKITWKASSISIQGTKYAIKPTDPKGNKKLGEITMTQESVDPKLLEILDLELLIKNYLLTK